MNEITINDFLEKFNVDIELEDKVRNTKLGLLDIDYYIKYDTVVENGVLKHIFSGTINEGTTDVEYHLYKKNEKVYWRYYYKHCFQTEKRSDSWIAFTKKNDYSG